MPTSRPLKSSNYSPVGWYIASYIHRFVVTDEENERVDRKFTIWRNTILVQAASPDEAYSKAVVAAKQGCKPYTNALGQRVRFVYEGLTSLVPVYEELNDGSELFWHAESRKLGTIRRLVKSKQQLEAFEREQAPKSVGIGRRGKRSTSEA